MAKVKLNAKKVAALSTDKRQQDFSDALVLGLCLRVSGTTSRKTWLVRYRTNGRQTRHKLGEYPIMSLADARNAARSALAAVDQGQYPGQERADQKAAGGNTFSEMAEEILAAERERGPARPATRGDEARISPDRDQISRARVGPAPSG